MAEGMRMEARRAKTKAWFTTASPGGECQTALRSTEALLNIIRPSTNGLG